jgi:hypothetical protein
LFLFLCYWIRLQRGLQQAVQEGFDLWLLCDLSLSFFPLNCVDLWLLLFQQGGAHLHRARAHRDLTEAEGGAKGGVQEEEEAAAPSEDPRLPQEPHQAQGIHVILTS